MATAKPPRETNEPHFHLWVRHASGRMEWRLAWPYRSKQAARQWGQRNRPDQNIRVEECYLRKCAPKLD